ncbi:MAG: zeta toxin family protein [Oscillospiraceae bacterium]|nr:zeta toxin family protein [Oscillospiraceae bacterium]
MRHFTILGGVNGVGKSTLAGVLTSVADDFGTLVDADRLTVQCGGNKLEGGRRAVKLLGECIRRGDDLTQETTLSGGKTARTIAEARENGYFVRLYYVAISSAEESLLRIKNRVRKGGHDIPEDVVRRRFAKRFDDLARILPLVDEAVLFDNENGFVHVADYRNGQLSAAGDHLPKWLDELKERLK